MSGHSKWVNTRYRKALQDRKKDKIFSKIIKELHTAIKLNNNINPQYNNRLKLVISKALSYNMNRIMINKIISKYFKENIKTTQNIHMKNLIYYGYMNNITFMINCLTDNCNRTVSFIRHTLYKYGGTLQNYNIVNHIFKYLVSFIYQINHNIDLIMDIAEKLVPEDFIINHDTIEMIFLKNKYKNILLQSKTFNIKPIKIIFNIVPYIKKQVNQCVKKQILFLIKDLLSNHDIQKVYHNADFIIDQ
ncbi:YebC/PmpR family DNA-binding transcriptional regulator [Enterobacteriaceae endosymbiont of Neohaemonia nigricornis]|uniref:YebC/PmpR family DNA-binding transcriptional regulator n=1 Tax=Enterobacteriaceae endosymbiont of Neohaemonia nigricornis TaxID=2675792 RepID=UPI001448D3F6|nr:YebC/PmpR family DNA-binding transcriptional regulator [Enterobacteriaceae endosymbiont of Neohaemonia nigricornis]QJC30589.1 hypothetical protein GJT85_02125 [Enterobacteriaceae endosymbiont of Neohaemonia nigricornis]